MRKIRVLAISLYDYPTAYRTKYFIQLFAKAEYEVKIIQPIYFPIVPLIKGRIRTFKELKYHMSFVLNRKEREVDGFRIENAPIYLSGRFVFPFISWLNEKLMMFYLKKIKWRDL